MIRTFQHRGLEVFYSTGSTRGINPQQADRIALRLDALNVARSVQQLDRPGWRLHRLVGDRAGYWSIRVTGNWRLTFRFMEGDCYDVNLEDYH